MIYIGYLITFVYIFYLLFGLSPFIQGKTNIETSRKLIHILLFVVWILMDLFFKNTIHQIIIPFLFLILNALSFRFHIYKSVERKEDNHLGTVYFAVAVLIVMILSYLHPQLYLPGGAAIFCLTFGDGFAALIGYHKGRIRLRKNKTLLGFISCLFASIISLFIFKVLYWHNLDLLDIVLLSCISSIAELTENGLDNITITLSVLAASWLLVIIGSNIGRIGLFIAIIVFCIVFFSKAISYAGSILAMGIVITFYCCGGWNGLLYLLSTYFSVFLIDILQIIVQPSRKKGGIQRSFVQIIINGGIGTMCIAFYGVFVQEWILALAITAIGGCFIDSVSSDFGSLSPQKPYDPFRRKYVDCGISGGMTVLGTSAAGLFSCGIGAFSLTVFSFSPKVAILIACLTFGQSLLDSAMGSLFQLKLKCSCCGKETEKDWHCSRQTVYKSGFYWMNNNMVNLISSMIIVSLSALLFSHVI